MQLAEGVEFLERNAHSNHREAPLGEVEMPPGQIHTRWPGAVATASSCRSWN